jgi:hypothetical protein
MQFQRDTVRFEYPDNWTVEADDSSEGGLQVSVSAPDGAFWSLSQLPAGCDPAELTAAAVAQLREDYPDLESEPAAETVFEQSLTGTDINFSCLDLTNTAAFRCLELPNGCYAVFCQAEDRDWQQLHHVFKAMTASLVRGLIANRP